MTSTNRKLQVSKPETRFASRDTQWPDVSEATRKIMRANKGKDTKPELIVRRLLHSMGYRYRLHRRDLPGTPDIILPKWRKAIMVHGCFWHCHANCRHAHIPVTRVGYWALKLAANKARDARNAAALLAAGWSVAIVWECETAHATELSTWLEQFIRSTSPQPRTAVNLELGSAWQIEEPHSGTEIAEI